MDEPSCVTKPRCVATAALFVLVMSLGADAGYADSVTDASLQHIVRIGHSAPLTGDAAHLGKGLERGVVLAVEEANARRLVIGGRRITFFLMSEDDEGRPDKGPIIAQKFADAKVAGVIGHMNSGVTIPASAVYEQHGIPMISGAASSPKLMEQGFRMVFRTVSRDDLQGPALARYLLQHRKPATAAVIDDGSAYGEGIADEVEKTLEAGGVHVLPREKGSPETRDWRGILTKLRGKRPDVIVYGGMDAAAAPLLKQGRELGLHALFAFGDAVCTGAMATLAGKAAEGFICSFGGMPTAAASKAFLKAHRSRFDAEPNPYADLTYDATNLLISAMQRAESTNPAEFVGELRKTSHSGASGHIAFDDKGDRKNSAVTISVMKSGSIQAVAIVVGQKALPVEDFLRSRADDVQR